jgi:hypothetical protein
VIQPAAGEHPTHRSAAGLPDQTDNQPDEGLEGGRGETRPEHGKQTGQRARRGRAGTDRQITLTRTVKERSMLSSSPSKIHAPRVTGVFPRTSAAPKLRNTRGYKNSMEAERAFRTMKSTLDLRPVYQRLDQRIRAHLLLCWLALLLVRVAERRTGHTWRHIARELGRIHQLTLTGPGRIGSRQRLAHA